MHEVFVSTEVMGFSGEPSWYDYYACENTSKVAFWKKSTLQSVLFMKLGFWGRISFLICSAIANCLFCLWWRMGLKSWPRKCYKIFCTNCTVLLVTRFILLCRCISQGL